MVWCGSVELAQRIQIVWWGRLEVNGYKWFGVAVWSSKDLNGLVRQCGAQGI
jgi:hypothetical protein